MGHWFIGSFDGTLLFPLLLGSLPGIIIGTYLARPLNERSEWSCLLCSAASASN